MYQWDFSFIWSYRWLFVNGTVVTLLFTVGIVVLGLAVGLLAGLLRLSRLAPLRWLAQAYVEVFRCTPVLVQLVWFYYALPILTGIEMSAITAATLALSLYGGAFYAEIIRGGINSIETGQTEAALALGMTPAQSMRRIVLPQALKRMVPPLMNQSIIQLKNTSLVSVLAVPDLLYQGQAVAHDTYRPLEIYSLVAVIYFVILFPLTLLVGRLERRLSRAD
ncbi:ectoine/hydroxyectoine ABC transporter permease subunit EhuC [Pseudoroseomonas wenyumeiae]|uniref:Glutamate/aspartate import permease protein GltK n=1 Tax=Teichococcus wenyumeiae TaxID=2478470 RepID=A0A3A9JH59_9PROT|nr:ectoine/hydroxyectoine ABC transporter permease subunit EhuC [Pseudoroseomonas wenyumeiae]RKK05710.1 ectoine/hydroxyectoine ABC transporter permease subunit EhuC [Pseudoroseomonas wenyumeiae]RMI25979.1 ectoine/hydroxyectoine ABC transporter permease subunit EhuC [Pseudoroseomonas wenyumeiae]